MCARSRAIMVYIYTKDLFKSLDETNHRNTKMYVSSKT